jgi:hypothetical protein
VDLIIEPFGDRQFARQLMRFGDAPADLLTGVAGEEIHADFLGIEKAQFDSEGVFGSGGWVPLKMSTIEQKAREGHDLRILHRTLAMRDSLTSASDANHVFLATRDELFIGTRVVSDRGFPYPAVHQRPIRSHLPRRRPVELREADRRRWVRILQRRLVEAFGRDH